MLDAALTPTLIHAADYAPPLFLIPSVRLRFELGAEFTLVTAQLRIVRNGNHMSALKLDGDDVHLVRVQLDGAILESAHYKVTPHGLEILDVPDAFDLEIVTRLNPAANTKLMGLYRSDSIFCTQCEAEGFRRITYFIDRPDVLSRYHVRLEANKIECPVLLSNGNLTAQGDLSDGAHFAEWTDPFPKPSYLFALVAGDLSALSDTFTTCSGRLVALNVWVAASDVPRCNHAMAALKASMLWDEINYGCEYDLDVFNIVAVHDFNFGAMENKGLNIFNAKYILADPDTATDFDYDGVEAVVAHEYFHNWTGNRITCRDWFQLSLKEGLTVYRDQEFSADQSSRALRRIETVRALRSGQFPEDAGPLAHPVRPDSYIEISNFYTATVYNKGAEVIRMLATLLGKGAYRAATDLYFERHDGAAVTCEDFVLCMEAASGRDLNQFRLWYAQAGTPQVKVSQNHADGIFTLKFTQAIPATPGQPTKLPMHIPIAVALYDSAAGSEIIAPHIVELRDAETTVTYPYAGAPPVASLLRNFTAPIIIERDVSPSALALLAACDSDPFARYEALQSLGLNNILNCVRTKSNAVDPLLVDAFRAALTGDLDPALVAEALVLPTESYIGDQMATIDVDGIHGARQHFRKYLASSLKNEFWNIYHCTANANFTLDPAAKSNRKLHNLALQYLMADADDEATAIAFLHYTDADNMTNRIAALAALCNSNAVERIEALKDFHTRYAHDPLVLDKWFSLQAMSSRADTLGAVKELSMRADFSLSNPNRVRALVGGFGSNQVRFHEASGDGYAFLASLVLSVDKINPQTAARLITPLGRWRRFDAGRAQLMRQQLEKIISVNSLSKDVYEIASKSLV